MMSRRRFDNSIGISSSTIGKVRPDGRKPHKRTFHVWIGAQCGYDLREIRRQVDLSKLSELSDILPKLSDSFTASP